MASGANLDVVHYGMGISLRLQHEWCMYVSSRGVADPKLSLRSREGHMPLLQFDRCVFRLQPAATDKSAAVTRKSDGSLKSGPVVYGRPVHIVHSYSGLYVTIVRKPAETDGSHFRVMLMSLEDAGSACRFKLLPRYKIRSEGDAVHNTDVVFIQQESSMLALHGKLAADATDDELSEVTATERPSPMEISLYDSVDLSMDADRRHYTLMAGAATMLFHREKDALLTIPSALERAENRSASSSNNPGSSGGAKSAASKVPPLPPTATPRNAKVIYPFFKGSKQAVANLSVETLEITCNSLWFFEHLDPSVGGPIHAITPCRIRHGVTGKYLVAEEHPLSRDFDVALRHLETPEQLHSAVFELELVASSANTTEVFSEKSFVIARHQMTGYYVTTTQSVNSASGSLGLTPHLNLEDTLAIVTVPREKQSELTFLIGNVEFLTKYIKKFNAMQDPSSTETVRDVNVAKVIQHAQDSLTALIRFCTDSADEDPLSREGLPLNDHQESMFQVSLHKIAMEVLLCPFVSASKENKLELPLTGGVLQMSDILKDEYKNVHTVCRLCYRLLKQMSKQSPHAALLLDYVDFMQEQEGYKLHVADTLMEVFTDNPNLPPERCEKDIHHFVKLLLKKGRSSGYLKFLSRLCVVGDTGVVENQRLVCQLVLDKHREDILYPTAVRDGQLMILLPKFIKKGEKDKKKEKKPDDGEKKEKKPEDKPLPQWVPLAQFLAEGDAKMVKFFESSVEMLGAMCVGADEECLRLTANCLPIDQLSIAIHPEFAASPSLRASYFTLALHLYLRKMLYNAMRVNNQLLERNSCGALVLGKNVAAEGVAKKPDLSAEESAALKTEAVAMNTIKQRALEYLQQCKGSLGDAGATKLVTTVTTIWHTFVSYNVYSKTEAHELVKAVVGAIGHVDDDADYAKNERTIIVIGAKRSLCQFLLNILRHEEDEVADRSVSHLVDGNYDDAVKTIEDGVKYLHETLFNLDVTLPILFDLLYYDDKELVSAAMESIVAICNSGATIAGRVSQAEPVRTAAAARAFKCFLAASAAMQQILSVTGNIIDEQSAIDIISAITSIDSSKIAGDKNPASATTPTTTSAAAAESQPSLGAAESSADFGPSASSSFAGTRSRGASLAPSAGGRLKAKVSSMMAVARVFHGVRERRTRWRSEDPASREVARLLYRSEVHKPLLECFPSVSNGSKLQVTLLEFFRVLSIDRQGSSELARHLEHIERCVFNENTCVDSAAIIFNVVKFNKHLAAAVSPDTVTQLVRLLSARRDPSFAEGLEHIVLGDFPLEKVQKQVLNHIMEFKLLADAASVTHDWTAQQLAFNSAIVNVVACCCVNNATCRASVSKALKAEDVMRILISDALPAAHLVPYAKYLCAACLSTDKESTAAELTSLRRLWTEHSQFWSLLLTGFFTRLTVGNDGFANAAVEELIFDGVVPCITAYLQNLYDPAVAAKARYAVPLSDIATKLMSFNSEIAKSNATFSARRMLAVSHAMAAVRKHAAHLPEAVAEVLLKDHTSVQALAAAKAEESSETAPVTIDRADELGKLYTKNGDDTLAPVVKAFSGNQPAKKLFETAIHHAKLHRLHVKLVGHLKRMDLQNDAACGLICTMRLSVSPLQDESEAEFEKGQEYLNDIGALRMVTEIISACTEEMAQEAFNLAIIILEGGNTEVQNKLLAHFMSTDERFFHDIGNITDRAVMQSRNRRAREIHGAFYGDTGTDKVVAGGTKYVLEVFRFLQLMCEGHHLGLQDYLRDQDDNLRSVNVVKEVLAFSNELVSSFDGSETDVALLNQSLALLTEVCQGPCVGNQELLANSGVNAMLNDILTSAAFEVQEPYDDDKANDLLQLKRGAITTVLAVLEGAKDESIPLVVLQEVPVSGLEAIIEQFIGTPEFKDSKNEDLCELVYGCVITLHTLVQCVSNPQHRERLAAEAVLAKHESKIGRLGKIEIERNNQIEKVYFRVPTICALLSEESKDALLWSVDRSTQGSKLSDFLDKADEIIYDIEATHRVQEQLKRNLLLKLFTRVSVKRWDDLSLGIALMINLLFIAVISDARGLLDAQTDWFGVEGLIRGFAFAQCLCTTLILTMDSSQNLPLVLYKQSKEIENPRWHDKLRAIVSRNETIFRTVSALMAWVGIFVNDFFFAVHLLAFITKSSVLKNVVVAVTQNGKSLVLTAMLGCIIVYLFALYGFAMFQEHFEEACGSLSQCVLHVLTTGLRQGGGIGDAMSGVKHGEPLYYSRLVYDSLFWVIMIVIFLNILFGIIIDTFAELRDEKSKKEEDMHTKCFICGIDSYTFDRYGPGFEKHVKAEHNMWAYLYFFHHLRRKDKNDYTGQESYVADMVERGDIGFFPAGKASSVNKNVTLDDGGDDDGEGGEHAVFVPRGGMDAAGGASAGGGGGLEPLSAHEGGMRLEDDEGFQRLMQKVESIVQAQQQQQQKEQQSKWVQKLKDVSRKAMTGGAASAAAAGAKQRGESPIDSEVAAASGEGPHDGAGPASRMTPQGSSMGGADGYMGRDAADVMSIREHKARMEHLQSASEKAKAQAVEDVSVKFKDAIAGLMAYTSRYAAMREELDAALDATFAQKEALFASAVLEAHTALVQRALDTEKQRQLIALELDGIRAKQDAAHRREALSSPGGLSGEASKQYVESMESLMREGDKYIQLIREAQRERQSRGGAAGSLSPDRSPPGRAPEASNK